MPALQELLSSFSENMRTSLENLFKRYHFSESQKLEIAKDESDLRQWKEKPFYSIADYTAIDSRKDGRKGDSYILQQRRYMETLRKGETDYSSFFPSVNPRLKYRTIGIDKPIVPGRCPCPVDGEKTRCCKLTTIDPVEQCAFSCSYCSVQAFYSEKEVHAVSGLKEKLMNLNLAPDVWHIGTGQASDSILLGDDYGTLSALSVFAKAHPEYTACPMSVCSAMSQGYIGYDLQNGIREELLNRGIYRTVSTILTQVIVDPYDEAFYTPTKVLGRYMNAQEANEERKKGNYVIEEAGKGFRRVVSAPNPVKIVELDAVNALLDADQVVIAAGGGGIPVMEQDNHLKGASAVIEKDLAAGKLAEGINADMLIILTNVEQVCINMGQENEEPLGEISVAQAKAYMEEGHFGVYNMYPKFRAAVEFIELREGRCAYISSFDKVKEALKGKTGTLIK